MFFKLCTVFFVLFGTIHCQYDSKGQQRFEQRPDGSGSSGQKQIYEDGSSGNSVEGEGAPEPPSLIPQTSFICEDKPYPLGMYADLETGCTVYHMCFDGRKESFLCGTGTVFNQEILSCDHPQNVICEDSPKYYSANTELGKSVPEPGGGGQRPDGGKPGGPGQRPDYGQRPTGPRPDFGRPTGPSGPGPSGPRPDYGRPTGPSGPGPSGPRPDFGRPTGPSGPGPSGPRPDYGKPSGPSRPVQPDYERPVQPGRPSPSGPGSRPVQPGRPVPSGPRPGKPSPGKPGKPRPPVGPGTPGRPLPPSSGRPRPRPIEPQRPIVQTSDDVGLDYEPSQLSYIEQRPAGSYRRAVYLRPVRQWRVMQESYA